MKKYVKSGVLPETDEETTLFEMKAQYLQNGDCTATDEINELTIKTQDGGGGVYYVIETKRWAVEKPEELVEILNDFIKRFSHGQTKV